MNNIMYRPCHQQQVQWHKDAPYTLNKVSTEHEGIGWIRNTPYIKL